MAMMGGYNKAVVAFPHHKGTTIVPTPLYLFCIPMEERVDVGAVNPQRVGPSMGKF